ncbi:MAG TPA: NAD(P)H-dependent oxidoreductase subunit E [Bacteroidales bacterium]|nr:NAD(P)H-dependent oxidoreductase subunit E [Bacteroidales bacterium]
MERSKILGKFAASMDNMLGVLHELQNNNPGNYLSQDDLMAVAEYMNTTYSHVYGVATYYTMYSLKPRGKYIVRVCNSPVCNMEGSTTIAEELMKILSVDVGGTTPDRLFTLELTECLGQCGEAPGIMINEDFHGNINRDKLISIIENYKTK